MALGSGWFKEEYKDMSLEELTKELENEKELYKSGEISRLEKERLEKGIDDNSPLADYESKINALEELIKEKNNSKGMLRKYKIDDKGNHNEEEIETNLPGFSETLNKKLTRKMLSDKFFGYHSKNNIINEEMTTKYLIDIKDFLNDYNYESDENFIMIGRKKFIYDEIIKVLNHEQKEKNPLCFVLGSLEEFMCDDNHISISEASTWDKGYNDLNNKNNSYIKKNEICIEEKNYIMDIINKIAKYISIVQNQFVNKQDDSKLTQNINFEKAKQQAEEIAKEVGKMIMEIKENEEYWYFETGLPDEQFFDDGAGSVYISKKDGIVVPMRLWLEEVQELNQKFSENSKTIYDYYAEKKETENTYTRNFKEELENCIISHNEFITKPPVYDIGYPLLLDHQNNNYVAWLLNNHTNFYVNDDSINNDFIPTAILIYNLSDKKSKIFKIDEFAKEFKIDILNAETKELMFDTIDIKNIINLKQNLNNDFISLLNDGVNIDFDKYNNYFSTLLSVVPTNQKKYYGLFDIKINNDKVLKLKCHSCGKELKIECSNYPKNIKTLDTMCDACKAMIKFGNLNYEVDKDLNKNNNELEIHIIEKKGIPTKQFENTLLYIKDDNVKVDNNNIKTNKNYDRNLLLSKIKSVLPKLRDISNQQTPEFLSQHVSYSDSSKIFNLVFNKEKISLNCKTGTDTDEFLNRLIEELIELIILKDDNLSADQTQKINDALDEDIENTKRTIKQAENLIFGENKDLNEAKKILLDFVAGANIFENSKENEYYNFHDIIDFVLYTRLNKPKKAKILWSSLPFGTAFSYLSYIYYEEKDYNNALKMIDKTIEWMPMATSPLFEKCETYKMQQNWEEFKKHTEYIYNKIFDPSSLAHYYRNLGYYYTEQNKLDIAYALYSASITFENNKQAYHEMMYINQLLKRDNYKMPVEEGLELLKQYAINFGIPQDNLNLLLSIYNSEKELLKNPSVEMNLSSRIYYLTMDKRFSPVIELIDKKVGCSILVPRTWKLEEKEKNSDITNNMMYLLRTDSNAIFQAIYDGKCSIENFDKAYNLNIENMKKSNMTLLNETINELKLQQGTKKFKCALFELNGIRLYNCFTLINNIFVNFSINVSAEIDYKDISKFNNQKNIIDLINVLASIIEVDVTKLNEENINDLKDFKCIYEEYITKKDYNLLENNIKKLITNKDVDPFWINSSRDTLIYLIVKNNLNGTLNYNEFIKLFSDKENFIKNCKENNDNLAINPQTSRVYKLLVSSTSEKMLEDYYKIILENIKIELKQELKENTFNIKMKNNYNFSINFPYQLNEIVQKDEVSAKIGNTINIMYANCSEKNNFEKRTSEWLERSAKTNNQIISNNVNKIKIGNIDVIEKSVSKDKIVRNYKFIYFNGAMLIFAYNKNEKISAIIDKAIETIKEVGNQEKKERNPFENPNKTDNEKNIPICPYCGQHLMFLMPDGQFLHCNKCEKYFKNDNGNVGDETSSPYTRTDVLY